MPSFKNFVFNSSYNIKHVKLKIKLYIKTLKNLNYLKTQSYIYLQNISK